MKSLALVLSYLSAPLRQRNTRVLLWLVVALVAMILAFTVIFHFLMGSEGREHSWATGFYWTLTVMSTLGFGDITFRSDPGRIFSVVVFGQRCPLLPRATALHLHPVRVHALDDPTRGF